MDAAFQRLKWTNKAALIIRVDENSYIVAVILTPHTSPFKVSLFVVSG